MAESLSLKKRAGVRARCSPGCNSWSFGEGGKKQKEGEGPKGGKGKKKKI